MKHMLSKREKKKGAKKEPVDGLADGRERLRRHFFLVHKKKKKKKAVGDLADGRPRAPAPSSSWSKVVLMRKCGAALLLHALVSKPLHCESALDVASE